MKKMIKRDNSWKCKIEIENYGGIFVDKRQKQNVFLLTLLF